MIPHKYRYEILDWFECVCALADCISDAQFAALKHKAKLIYDTKRRVFIAMTDV